MSWCQKNSRTLQTQTFLCLVGSFLRSFGWWQEGDQNTPSRANVCGFEFFGLNFVSNSTTQGGQRSDGFRRQFPSHLELGSKFVWWKEQLQVHLVGNQDGIFVEDDHYEKGTKGTKGTMAWWCLPRICGWTVITVIVWLKQMICMCMHSCWYPLLYQHQDSL